MVSAAWSAAAAEDPSKILAPAERMKIEHLRVVHEAREKFAKERSTSHIMPNGIYEDFRAALNVHASEAELPEAIAAARKDGVKVLAVSGAALKKPGLDDGLLLLPATESGGDLEIGSSAPSFLSSTLQFRGVPKTDLPESYKGFQICTLQGCQWMMWEKLNRQDDAAWARLKDGFKKFPEEFFTAGQLYDSEAISLWDNALAQRPFCCVANNAETQYGTVKGERFGSFDLDFRAISTHVLAREFSEKEIRKSLAIGRSYVSYDWLADPTGFIFGAGSLLGTFVMGDSVPYYVGSVKLGVFSPLPAHLRILREGKIVAEGDGNQLLFDTKETGTFRCEAWLKVDGELRPWVISNPIYLQGLSLASATVLKIPDYRASPDVRVENGVTYIAGQKEDEAKHKLDIYRPKEMPKDKKTLPVLMFVHGGSWRTGDRSQYGPLGNFLAKNGIVAFIPSYRLAPQNKFPAQIEDVAAAFKYTVEHCAEFGGDPERIYVAGHSAGGHLAGLLTFDTRYLAEQKISPRSIKGAICLSGVYDLVAIGDSQASVFGSDKDARRDASPLFHVKAPAPRMLISCCQHDYLSLPQQAKDFFNAVKAAGADAEFLYVPDENHISEMINVMEPEDLTGKAILKFVR